MATIAEGRVAYDGVPAKMVDDQPCRCDGCNERENARYEPADLARIR